MGSRQKLMQISNQLRSEVVRLNEGERKMREYITSVENVISGLNDQLVEAEAAESTALAEEDYAKAEEISTRSAALKKELEAKHAEIQTCLQRNGQATQMRVNKIQNELVTIDAMIKGFDAAYTSVNGMFEEMVKKLDEQSAAHDARLAQMMGVINEKEEALAKSREAIAAEKEVIEEKIREDCVDLYKEKEEAGMLKLTLDEEIASLKQQLHQKNQELLACTKHIAETDQKIQQVRVKYLPQFQPIEEKNKALSGDVKAIETLKTQYNTAAGRVEMVKKSFDEDKKAKKEIVDTRKDELDVITCLADALKSYDRLIVETFQPLTTKQNAVGCRERERLMVDVRDAEGAGGEQHPLEGHHEPHAGAGEHDQHQRGHHQRDLHQAARAGAAEDRGGRCQELQDGRTGDLADQAAAGQEGVGQHGVGLCAGGAERNQVGQCGGAGRAGSEEGRVRGVASRLSASLLRLAA